MLWVPEFAVGPHEINPKPSSGRFLELDDFHGVGDIVLEAGLFQPFPEGRGAGDECFPMVNLRF